MKKSIFIGTLLSLLFAIGTASIFAGGAADWNGVANQLKKKVKGLSKLAEGTDKATKKLARRALTAINEVLDEDNVHDAQEAARDQKLFERVQALQESLEGNPTVAKAAALLADGVGRRVKRLREAFTSAVATTTTTATQEPASKEVLQAASELREHLWSWFAYHLDYHPLWHYMIVSILKPLSATGSGTKDSIRTVVESTIPEFFERMVPDATDVLKEGPYAGTLPADSIPPIFKRSGVQELIDNLRSMLTQTK